MITGRAAACRARSHTKNNSRRGIMPERDRRRRDLMKADIDGRSDNYRVDALMRPTNFGHQRLLLGVKIGLHDANIGRLTDGLSEENIGGKTIYWIFPPGSGPGGRWFESTRPDQTLQKRSQSERLSWKANLLHKSLKSRIRPELVKRRIVEFA